MNTNFVLDDKQRMKASEWEAIKIKHREVIADLSKTIELLKAAEKEKKATLKEVESVRATLRSLQKVDL